MMFDVNISSVRVPRSIIAFRSKIQTGPILEKGFDIDQDRFHITCRIPMWQFYNFDGCDSEHHWPLQPWSYDLDQGWEEGVQVHGEVQLKLYVIISKSWFQFFKILFQQAEKWSQCYVCYVISMCNKYLTLKNYTYFELAKLLSFTFHWKILSSIVSALIPVSEADSIIDTKSLMRMPDAASVLKT